MSALTFSDILIEPRYSTVLSRKDVDLTTDFHGFKLSLPVISANMKSITEYKMCCAMKDEGGLGILHRFYTSTEEYIEQVKQCVQYCGNHFGVSVGVKDKDKELTERLYEAGARIFCIDVAHGDHILVKNMLKFLQGVNDVNGPITIIAGNIATSWGAMDLVGWGCKILKVGIGPGSVCMTRRNTGVGVPQLHALMEIDKVLKDWHCRHEVNIISDGGIVFPGDVSKALIYSDAVMVGSFISGTKETPGNVFVDEKQQHYKVYYGSASGESKNNNHQDVNFVEGVTTKVPFKGKVKYLLQQIREGVQSAFSYTGVMTLKSFQEEAEIIVISGAGKTESKI